MRLAEMCEEGGKLDFHLMLHTPLLVSPSFFLFLNQANGPIIGSGKQRGEAEWRVSEYNL